MPVLPRPGHVIIHTGHGDLELPESQALPYKPEPIVVVNTRFLWNRNVPEDEAPLYRRRLGESVRFQREAVSPLIGDVVPGHAGVFIREDHEIHTLTAAAFFEKYGWV
jgi:hypothetical protein